MKKSEFINVIAPLVQAENKKRGNPLFSSVVIAQAICESGWGQSTIMMKANAVFGIKAGSSWKGKVYDSKTKECYDGVTMSTINACFRAYDNLQDSISDYFDLITGLNRYKKALNCSNYKECITAIKNGGYATDPKYIDTIISIIESNNLTTYDVENVENLLENSDITAIVKEVIEGKWGNGESRKQALTKAGYNASEVQAKVNELLGTTKADITAIAKEVIAGKWGNGELRKQALKKAGYDYSKVQAKVNELLK